jgi:hypothetical protein
MKHELFVEQPILDIKEGIKVTVETVLSYKTDRVEQVLNNLTLETIMCDSGSNGTNEYKSKTHISLTLNPGDILLFDSQRGYYMPPYPVTSIDDAISDITSLSDIPRYKEVG